MSFGKQFVFWFGSLILIASTKIRLMQFTLILIRYLHQLLSPFAPTQFSSMFIRKSVRTMGILVFISAGVVCPCAQLPNKLGHSSENQTS